MTDLQPVLIPEEQLKILDRDVYRGRGSSVTLHRVGLGSQTLLYKVYKPDFSITRAPLEELVRWRLDLPTADRDYLDASSAFPSHIVTNDTGIAGICMQEAPSSFFFQQLRRDVMQARSLDYLSNTPAHAQTVGDSYFEPPHKMAILGDLLSFILWLHSRDVVIGDLNAENVLVSDKPGPGKFIALDCDSLWIAGRSAMPKHEPPPMRCPWGPEDRFTEETDLYKFALLSVRCLQEDNAEDRPNHSYLAKIMPSDESHCLLSLLDREAWPSLSRIQALSRTWSRRMAPDGRLAGSNDSVMLYDWRPGMAPTPRSTLPATAGVSSSKTSVRRPVLVAAGLLLLILAFLIVLLVV